MVYFAEYSSPVGMLLLTCEGDALTSLWMIRKIPEGAVTGADHPVLQQAASWLDDYFSGKAESISFPIAPSGTEFQQRVWQRLLQIPWGQTCTYGDIAKEIARETGKPMSAQAVGGAVGRNPISILIPCHRVVGAKGQLTGYAGGLASKAWLLHHEGWKGPESYDHQ